MATTVPPTQERRAASRRKRSGRAGGRRHDDDRHRALVSDTLASLRDGGVKRFARASRPMETARTMLDRLRSR